MSSTVNVIYLMLCVWFNDISHLFSFESRSGSQERLPRLTLSRPVCLRFGFCGPLVCQS
eukprot:m.43524 g.43524  ORF g.43524 m.43524 type:complete len:59 (+) comp33450_c1_seq1:23-199(+)